MRDLLYSLVDKASPLGPGGDAGLLRKALNELNIKRHGGVALVDIGAAGDLPPRFVPIQPYVAYTGFEPDERARRSLLAKTTDCLSYTILPEGIGPEHGSVTLHLTRGQVFSSAFEPNRPILDRYPESEVFDVVEDFKMDVVPLDSLDLPRCDFIKVDIQGGELAALRGGARTLGRCLGIEAEVEISELYKGQPLFPDVLAFAKESGFEFIDFMSFGRWSRDRKDRLGQCLYADALFLRPPEQVAERADDEVWIAAYLALLMIYRRYDLARTMLRLLPADHPVKAGSFPATLEKAADRQGRIFAFQRLALRLMTGDTPGYRAHLLY